MSCSKKCGKDCTKCEKCRAKNLRKEPKIKEKPPKFGACGGWKGTWQDDHSPLAYINNPYYEYTDYYVMMNGRNRQMIHRCGIEDYYRKMVFDGINLAPHVHRQQFYSYLITYLKGVYNDIIKNQIYHPQLNADKSAKLIIKRILKTIIGEFEAIKVMHLWEVSKCKVCTDYDYPKYNCPPPENNPPQEITSKEWNPTNWNWNRPMNWNWGPMDQYYSRAPF